MCRDLKDFDTPPYHYSRSLNCIGYQSMDNICYEMVYGYRTAFAYLNEASKRSLRDMEAALRRALQLRVPCGQFSYADIDPACILGVSGTIEALGDYEWRVMNRYGIEHYSQMPSVYGHNKLSFLDQAGGRRPITVVSSKEDWFVAITEEANQAIRVDRAVIVFFEEGKDLEEYKASPYYRKVANRSELRESQSHQEKEYAIKKAATAGQATFTTAPFGRGTDFFCSDPKVLAAGGVLVVQTFFSLDKSEEVQIQGRTARQGKEGTYSLVLLQEALTTQLGVTQAALKDKRPAELYAYLDEARQRCRAAACKKVEDSLHGARERDALTHRYFDALLSNDRRASIKAFAALYADIGPKAKSERRQSRMICLSDATMSMTWLWKSTKKHIQEMLLRIKEIGGSNLELQWMAYRDYSCGNRLLERSGWTTDPAVLQGFVDSIQLLSGADFEEAVEHALAAVRAEHAVQPVTRVLLIGDAAPHSESKGAYLHLHRVHLATDYKLEADWLAEAGIPVYTFYLREHARQSLCHIARTTGGAAQELANPQDLLDVVCENALDDIGGAELVAEYKAR
uniref:SecA family profile domain-containing protein n=1 Tax=Alexandrium monilatum TaxID=311494 RepID=A0A6T1DUP4_9DINO